MAHSPHRRFKGCCLMCAAWVRGDGRARRMPVSALRRVGQSRRITKATLAGDRD